VPCLGLNQLTLPCSYFNFDERNRIGTKTYTSLGRFLSKIQSPMCGGCV
jgi:hypothetical protein